MKLSSNDPIFDRVPAEFFSPFPSDDALLDQKFAALMEGVVPDEFGKLGTIGQAIFTRAQARAWRDALALANKAKATIAGDIPTNWLPRIAWLDKLRPGVEAFEGLWAEVDWSTSRDPVMLGKDVAEVGLQTALNFVGAVPIVGKLMAGIVGLGDFISRLFDSPAPIQQKRILLPWGSYSKSTDQDLVQKFLVETYCPGVDWTNIFLPPFEPVPWKIADGVQDGEIVGQMFAPISGGQVAWSTTGLGAMPGTERVAGLIQSPKVPQADPRLLRYFSDGTMFRWGRALTDTGDFLPAFAQTCTLLWQQCQKGGSPDMYKLDLDKIELAWEEYFGTFFESVWSEFAKDEWAGEFAAPYLAVTGAKTRLGLKRNGYDPLPRPMPAPLITPKIFAEGAGTVLTRNSCAWLEPRQGPTWPYPEGSYSTAQLGPYPPPYKRVNQRIALSGGPAWPIGSPLSAGAKCRPWPEPEDLLVKYSSPFEAMIKPAIDRMRQLQTKCLTSTLVTAYVRVTESGGMPPYAAFAASPTLRAKALDARQLLLAHEARFGILLSDVDEVDPAFADQLRASGVTNSPAQLAQARGLGLKIGQGGKGGEDELPSALPPQGGSPWAPPDRPSSGGGGAGLAIAGVGLGALLLL
ncbi:hypothetical protein [Nannocystis pusilla]|uniref:Uncharacterized protein n=1 Tax=Nannocystis pusilla TaxID=889268 RepID=A0ABS7U4M2_9BACT|nr:hypothetical protein [Nannocystis pusilla]MBZ5715277.1 hypothetical protein [Nannocystis pusilla]